MATHYVDLEGGNDANDGTSFALRKKTMNSVSPAGGDTVRVMASPPVQSVGQDATWTNGSNLVTLTSAVAQVIDDCETAWTASTNVTASAATTYYKHGTKSVQLAIASAFTTGKVAYRTLPAALDLSGYQQISFQLRANSAITADRLRLVLCSDTTGDTVVDQVTIPAFGASAWGALTFDLGAALGSSIQSVAIYADVDPGSLTFSIDQITACKASSAADSITLTSLISKNTDADEPWYTVDAIDGTTIRLGVCGVGSFTSMGICNYFGATATVALYKREPVLLSAAESPKGSSTAVSWEFGWNRTDMSTQDDVTWIRAKNPVNRAIYASNQGCRFNKVYGVSSGEGALVSTGAMMCYGECGAAGSYYGIWLNQPTASRVDDCRFIVGTLRQIYANGNGSGPLRLKVKKAWGVGDVLFSQVLNYAVAGSGLTCEAEFTDARSGSRVVDQGTGNLLRLTVRNSTFTGFALDFVCTCDVHLFNCTNPGYTAPTVSLFMNFIMKMTKYNGGADNHKVYDRSTNRVIEADTTTRHTESGYSWKFKAEFSYAPWNDPVAMPVARIACPANELRTVKLWVRRSNTTQQIRLILPGGQIAGVSSDVYADCAAAIDTWEELTITFTPTEKGVVEVFAHVWGASGTPTPYGWVDDLTVL